NFSYPFNLTIFKNNDKKKHK
ncbi:hypothetical protein, partial [Plasmodium yoelii yoelii]